MRNPIKLSKWNRYVIGVSVSIAVLVVNQMFIQYWLYEKNEDARTINLAGRQRMLSQKLNLELVRMANRDLSRPAVDKTYSEWKKAHYGLLNGNLGIGIYQVKEPQSQQMLNRLSANVEYVGQIINRRTVFTPGLLASVNLNQAYFLGQMEVVVKRLEEDSNRQLRFIQWMEIVLAVFSIFVVLVKVRYIYEPAERDLRQAIGLLEDSENKLLAILDSTTDCNVFLSRDMKVINSNRTAKENARKIYGREIKSGDDFRNYAKHNKDFDRQFGGVLAGKAANTECEFELGGVRRWYQVRFFPVYDKHHQMIGVSYNSTDIDHKKRAEIKIKTQLDIFREIAWEQSHTVRAPVANILGILYLMNSPEQKVTEYEKAEYLNLLSEQATKLDGIIHGIVQKTARVRP